MNRGVAVERPEMRLKLSQVSFKDRREDQATSPQDPSLVWNFLDTRSKSKLSSQISVEGRMSPGLKDVNG